ncbi:hypothetical protein DPMN_070276 [Dreissena polymorpha]|uniref:Uncharacterized protein n=1 Tax=Dreissena polymorpha TaxID=45954 RepID=A0A9D3Z518_DREPO|nr:hypothetical protein DPMN_070276 [Dreissena polymorpha]
MYDPMGMLSSVTVCAKILVQKPWKNGYDRNTSLTVDIVDKWSSIASNLNIALNSSFQRIYLTSQTKTISRYAWATLLSCMTTLNRDFSGPCCGRRASHQK